MLPFVFWCQKNTCLEYHGPSTSIECLATAQDTRRNWVSRCNHLTGMFLRGNIKSNEVKEKDNRNGAKERRKWKGMVWREKVGGMGRGWLGEEKKREQFAVRHWPLLLHARPEFMWNHFSLLLSQMVTSLSLASRVPGKSTLTISESPSILSAVYAWWYNHFYWAPIWIP